MLERVMGSCDPAIGDGRTQAATGPLTLDPRFYPARTVGNALFREFDAPI